MVQSIDKKAIDYWQRCINECGLVPKVTLFDIQHSDGKHLILVQSRKGEHETHSAYFIEAFLATFDNVEEAMIWIELDLNVRREDIKITHAYTSYKFP